MNTPATLEESNALVAELRKEIDDLENEMDDHECECDHIDQEDPAHAVDRWLTRAKGLGQLTAAEAAVVERLLEDLR